MLWFRTQAVDAVGDEPGPTAQSGLAQQQTILAMIDTPQRPEWSHTAYWAPFILVGNPD